MGDERKDIPVTLPPKGCREIPRSASRVPFLHRILAPSTDMDEWQRYWKVKEVNAVNAFRGIFTSVLNGVSNVNLAPYLDTVDEETKLTRRVLLSQAVREAREGKFIITTANRVGIEAETNGKFALGGAFEWTCQYQHKDATRVVEGTIIGIVLNQEIFASLREGSSMKITYRPILEVIAALISAHTILAKYDLSDPKLLTKEEFNTAFQWATLGKVSELQL